MVSVWTCFTGAAAAFFMAGTLDCLVAAAGSAIGLQNCATVSLLNFLGLGSCAFILQAGPLNCVGTVSGVPVLVVDILFWTIP